MFRAVLYCLEEDGSACRQQWLQSQEDPLFPLHQIMPVLNSKGERFVSCKVCAEFGDPDASEWRKDDAFWNSLETRADHEERRKQGCIVRGDIKKLPFLRRPPKSIVFQGPL
jgi:hypothetical protein